MLKKMIPSGMQWVEVEETCQCEDKKNSNGSKEGDTPLIPIKGDRPGTKTG